MLNQFPDLESLGLDLDWFQDEWPYDKITHIRRMEHLKHLEINLPVVFNDFDVSTSFIDENACVRLLNFLEAGLETGLKPIFLKSLHVKLGEWYSPPYSYKRSFLFVGERDSSSGMHFHRMNEKIHPTWLDKARQRNLKNKKGASDSNLPDTQPSNDSIQAPWLIQHRQSQSPVPPYYSSWAKTPVGR
ncbi:hypothetical protein N7490_011357 [Penicillium lividum]|nr:hypothetical protein N7490_011357 [Penicillium lividum]